jgi:patatin-like phospholipase/acyl hydrolase
VVLKNISPDGQPSPQKLMITGYDTMRRQPIFFKSWRHERWYSAVKLWEACVCSASAPTYFPAYLLESPFNPSEQYSMIDGGVGVNNPTASAIAEAIRLLGEEQAAVSDGVPSLDRIINQITVVSVGTGDLTKSFPWRQVRSWGLAEWAPHIVDVIMDAPSDVQQYIAEQIATRARQDETPCYLRLQPKLRQEFEAIDNASTEYLAQLIDITDTYLATQQAAIAQTLQC